MPLIDRFRRAAAGPVGRGAFDVMLAVTFLALTLVINLRGGESVPANRDNDALTIALTVVAVGSIVVRRRWPLTVLALTLAAILALIAVKGTVGAATLGPFVAAYTAVAHGTVRSAQKAVAIVVLALGLTWVLDPVDLSGSGAVLSIGVFGAALLLGNGTRERRERAVADVRAAEHSATLDRLRITRELHDVLGHAMSVMVVQAGAAGRLLDIDDTPRARAAVAEIERTGRQSMNEMRHLLGVLREGEDEPESPLAPAPTLADIDSLVGRVRDAGLETTLATTGERGAVSTGIDLAAYRIVQEALTNCLKHAAATHAQVTISYDADQVSVEVDDDGRGPAAGGADVTRGHGLAGMRERVAMYDGQLTVGERTGGGFRVRAVLPRGVMA